MKWDVETQVHGDVLWYNFVQQPIINLGRHLVYLSLTTHITQKSNSRVIVSEFLGTTPFSVEVGSRQSLLQQSQLSQSAFFEAKPWGDDVLIRQRCY